MPRRCSIVYLKDILRVKILLFFGIKFPGCQLRDMTAFAFTDFATAVWIILIALGLKYQYTERMILY